MASSIYGSICLAFLFGPIPTRGNYNSSINSCRYGSYVNSKGQNQSGYDRDPMIEMFPSVERAREYIEASIKPCAKRKVRVLTCNDGPFNEFFDNLLDESMRAMHVEYDIVATLSHYTEVFNLTANGGNATLEVDLMFCAHFLTHDRVAKGVVFALPIMEKGTIILTQRGLGRRRISQPLLAFEPFHPLVWIAFAALIIITAIVIWCFENDSEEFRNKRVSERSSLMIRTLLASHVESDSEKTGLGTYLYDLSTGLFQVNWISTPQSSGTKVLMIGFSFVSIAFAASYIAQLTVVLENAFKLQSDVPETWAELADPKYTICIPRGTFLAENAIRTHPAVNFLNVSGVDDGMKALKSKRCTGVLYDRPAMELELKEMCDGVLIHGTASQSMPYVVGFHVNSPWVELVGALSTVLIQMRSTKFSGKFGFLEEMYDNSFRAQSNECRTTETSGTPEAIEFRQMTGLFALHLIFILMSGCLHACRRGGLHRKQRERKNSDVSVTSRNSDAESDGAMSHTSGNSPSAFVIRSAQVHASAAEAQVHASAAEAGEFLPVSHEGWPNIPVPSPTVLSNLRDAYVSNLRERGIPHTGLNVDSEIAASKTSIV